MKNSVRFQYYIFSTVSLLVNPFWLLRKEEKTDKIPSSSVLYCILKVCTESRINRAATLRFVASIGVVLGAKKSPEALKPADGRSEFWLRALQYNMEHVILLPIPQTHDSTYGLRRLRTVFTISPLCFLRSHRAAIWEYEIRKEEQGRISPVLTNLWLHFIACVGYSSSVTIWLSKLGYFLKFSEPGQKFEALVG